jgi:hypothetical protein
LNYYKGPLIPVDVAVFVVRRNGSSSERIVVSAVSKAQASYRAFQKLSSSLDVPLGTVYARYKVDKVELV